MAIKNISFEKLLLKLFENQISSQLLLKKSLYKVDPHLFNGNDSFSAAGIKSDYEIHNFPEDLRSILKGYYSFIVFPHFAPDLLSEFRFDLLILMNVIHVFGAVLKKLIVEPVSKVAFRENSIY